LKIGQKKCPKMDFPKKSFPKHFIDTTREGIEFHPKTPKKGIFPYIM